MNSYPEPPAEPSPKRRRSSTSSRSTSACAPSCAWNFSTPRPPITANRPVPGARARRSSSLLEILAITARGDSRSDVLKELERQVNVLKEYQSKTGVDPGRLKSLMSNLVKLRERFGDGRRKLHGTAARLGILERHQASQRHPRRHLRFRPAGLFLLAQSARRSARRGIRQLAGVDPAAVRQHRRVAVADAAERQAQIGSRGRRHLSNCNSIARIPASWCASPCRPDSDLFPEISGSQHRCTIRFLKWLDATSRPVHVEVDVPFLLTCCA